jgi:hypothetical protein
MGFDTPPYVRLSDYAIREKVKAGHYRKFSFCWWNEDMPVVLVLIVCLFVYFCNFSFYISIFCLDGA